MRRKNLLKLCVCLFLSFFSHIAIAEDHEPATTSSKPIQERELKILAAAVFHLAQFSSLKLEKDTPKQSKFEFCFVNSEDVQKAFDSISTDAKVHGLNIESQSKSLSQLNKSNSCDVIYISEEKKVGQDNSLANMVLTGTTLIITNLKRFFPKPAAVLLSEINNHLSLNIGKASLEANNVTLDAEVMALAAPE